MTPQKVLLELDSVLPMASSTIAAAGLADRIELVAADFFAAVPAADAYLVKSNLYNFGFGDALKLPRVVRRGDTPVFVIETMIRPETIRRYSKFDDIKMMSIAGGNDRREQEWFRTRHRRRFAVQTVLPAAERFSVLVADPSDSRLATSKATIAAQLATPRLRTRTTSPRALQRSAGRGRPNRVPALLGLWSRSESEARHVSNPKSNGRSTGRTPPV
ncbi:hypothetical protein GCM10029976_042690 [Kribbella albertanoniae]|nr:methyltransferase [Kribbella albertanoniae]